MISNKPNTKLLKFFYSANCALLEGFPPRVIPIWIPSSTSRFQALSHSSYARSCIMKCCRSRLFLVGSVSKSWVNASTDMRGVMHIPMSGFAWGLAFWKTCTTTLSLAWAIALRAGDPAGPVGYTWIEWMACIYLKEEHLPVYICCHCRGENVLKVLLSAELGMF